MRRTCSALAAAALTLGLLSAGLPTAQADPIRDARQQAAALRHKVDQLRLQAAIATEDYDASYEELGQAVTAHLLAKQRLDEVRVLSGGADDEAQRRVRALYISGGVPALYAKVLDSGSLSDFASRVHHVNVVLHSDQRVVEQANTAVADQRRGERVLAAAAAKATTLQAAVADRADAVRGLLAQTDALLDAADQKVRDLAEQQRRAAEAAAAARAAQAFAGGLLPRPRPPGCRGQPARGRGGLAFARTRLGLPYVWGAVGPDSFDCSGLTGAAYRAAGLSLPAHLTPAVVRRARTSASATCSPVTCCSGPPTSTTPGRSTT